MKKPPHSAIHFSEISPYNKDGKARVWSLEDYEYSFPHATLDWARNLPGSIRQKRARVRASTRLSRLGEIASRRFHKPQFLVQLQRVLPSLYKKLFSFLRWLTSPLLVIALVAYIFYPRTGDVVYAQHIDTFSPAPAMVETKPVAPITTAPALPQVAELPMPPPVIAEPGAFGNTYVAGQCTWGVASRVHIPNNWGNANQWAASATAAGWSVGTTPKYGAIAVSLYDSYWGHVALVIDNNGTIWEENGAYGPFTSDTRSPNPGEFQYYIYPQL